MLEAMSMALTELSGVLGIERIDLRVSGDDVTFVPAESPAAARPIDLSSEQARFSLRLPDELKAKVDARAASEGISTNTWIVRALDAATGRGIPSSPRNRRLSGYGQA
jgi:hypothetical protein